MLMQHYDGNTQRLLQKSFYFSIIKFVCGHPTSSDPRGGHNHVGAGGTHGRQAFLPDVAVREDSPLPLSQ